MKLTSWFHPTWFLFYSRFLPLPPPFSTVQARNIIQGFSSFLVSTKAYFVFSLVLSPPPSIRNPFGQFNADLPLYLKTLIYLYMPPDSLISPSLLPPIPAHSRDLPDISHRCEEITHTSTSYRPRLDLHGFMAHRTSLVHVSYQKKVVVRLLLLL